MKFPNIAVAALALLLPSVVGCSDQGSDAHESVGRIQMQLKLPSGADITTINYEITHSNGYEDDGSVPAGNKSSVRFQIGGIPAASGYTMDLSATTSTGQACTAQPVSFDVQAGATSLIMMTLRCGGEGAGATSGNVRVQVDVEEDPTCPEIDGLTGVPLEVLVGATVTFSAEATIAGAAFAWSAAPTSVGSFAPANAASTVFTCNEAGAAVVTLTVTGASGCAPSVETIPVICSSETDAGSGPVDAGNPPPVDAGNPPPADAGNPPPVDAGNPPPVDAGTPPEDAGNPPPVDAGTPPEDAGNPPPVDAGPEPDRCAACRDLNCRDYLGIDLVAGCFEAVNPEFGADVSDPTFIQDCINVITCARANDCAYSVEQQATGCYCGSNSIDVCANSGPAADAKCVPQWQAAARSTTNSEVQGRFTDLGFPAGWAYFLLDCDAKSCNSAESGDCTIP